MLFGPLNEPCQAGWKLNYDDDDLKIIGAEHRVQPNSDTLDYRPLSASEASRRFSLPDGHSEKLTDEHIAQYGFFRHFNYGALYAPIIEGNSLKDTGPKRSDVDTLMEQKEPLWDLLAHAIPARSFAAASNSLTKLDPENRNINMHLMRGDNPEKTVYWPRERLNDENYLADWLHSDVRDMALPYVYQVYEKMLDEGSLRE